MKAIINITTGTDVMEYHLELNTSVIIGRSDKSTCKVPDQKLSSTHCQLTLRPDQLEVVDLESKNGTYLNGIRIEFSEMFIGDEIKVGRSYITLNSKRMDSESIEVLTFPGPMKDRVNSALQMDFTGARVVNQLHQHEPSSPPSDLTQIKEVAIRKELKSRIRLSKQTIKKRNKPRSWVALGADLLFIFVIQFFPLIFINEFSTKAVELTMNDRLSTYVALDSLVLLVFLNLNFKMLKFSLGEKLAGIENLYQTQ